MLLFSTMMRKICKMSITDSFTYYFFQGNLNLCAHPSQRKNAKGSGVLTKLNSKKGVYGEISFWLTIISFFMYIAVVGYGRGDRAFFDLSTPYKIYFIFMSNFFVA
jgi:hypothetical protein